MLQEATDNPLLDMSQEEGEIVYFGIHDLDRYYKAHNCIPPIDFSDIMDKTGEITEVDPIESEVHVKVEKDPFHFGYHGLENKAQRDKRKKRGGDITLPSSSLIDISHVIGGERKVWLVVDSKTKYQAGLMKQIRRKEMIAYMDKEASETEYMLDDTDDPFDIEMQDEYQLKNREIVPYYTFNQGTEFKPSINKNECCWKYYSESKRYNYYPED